MYTAQGCVSLSYVKRSSSAVRIEDERIIHCFIVQRRYFHLFYTPAGEYTLTSQERAHARFQIVSFLGKEVFAHDVYTKDELRTFCA